MAMLGKVEELVELVNPQSRLGRALALLKDFVEGRFPQITKEAAALKSGESRRIALDGEALFMLLQCYEPRARQQGRFEAHQRHTDLQFILSGCECVEVCDVCTFKPAAAYDSQGNAFFPIGDTVNTRLLLQAGNVAVLSPGDAHAPCLRTTDDGSALVRKIVVKIQDAHLPASSAISTTATHPPDNLETPQVTLET